MLEEIEHTIPKQVLSELGVHFPMILDVGDKGGGDTIVRDGDIKADALGAVVSKA
jgi:hypothetical protein